MVPLLDCRPRLRADLSSSAKCESCDSLTSTRFGPSNYDRSVDASSPSPRTERILAYFASCNGGDVAEVAAHFTESATIFDTNHDPVIGAEAIGEFWDRIRTQWRGAVWGVESIVTDGEVAAIEWHMRGSTSEGPFVFRGSEHYAFEGDLISEIRQYWTFDRSRSDTGLRGYDYQRRP